MFKILLGETRVPLSMERATAAARAALPRRVGQTCLRCQICNEEYSLNFVKAAGKLSTLFLDFQRTWDILPALPKAHSSDNPLRDCTLSVDFYVRRHV